MCQPPKNFDECSFLNNLYKNKYEDLMKENRELTDTIEKQRQYILTINQEKDSLNEHIKKLQSDNDYLRNKYLLIITIIAVGIILWGVRKYSRSKC